MTGKQRIEAALSGVMPDKRPVMLHNFMAAIYEAGYNHKQYRESPEIAAQCHIRYAEKYGLDGIFFDVDTAITASAVGMKVDYPDNEPARAHEIFLNSLDDIDQLKDIDISQHPRIIHSLEAVRLLKKHFGNELFIRGNCDQSPFSLACCLRTPANFMMDLFLDEERTVKLLEYCTKICLQFIQLMSETGADMISNGDSPAGPSMISPELYEQFALPYEKILQDETRKLDLPYLLHICGDTTLILPQMSKIGLDAVELDYKTPIDEIHKTFGDKTTVFGTIDPSGIFAFGAPEKVRKEAVKIFDIYKHNPRLVIGPGCALPPFTPEENIREIVKIAHNE